MRLKGAKRDVLVKNLLSLFKDDPIAGILAFQQFYHDGKNLGSYLDRKKVKINAVVEAVGVERSTLNRKLNGLSQMTTKELLKYFEFVLSFKT